MSDQRMPFQDFDCYAVAREIAKRVHTAHIPDAELRDQATRAAKSTFLNLCEGLPQRGAPLRRKYFTAALGSLHETVGAVDLAEAVGALGAEEAHAVAALGERLRRMLLALMR
jgi:four helix bundle protein